MKKHIFMFVVLIASFLLSSLAVLAHSEAQTVPMQMQPGTVITYSDDLEMNILIGGYDNTIASMEKRNNDFELRLVPIPDGATEEEIAQIEYENRLVENEYNIIISGEINHLPDPIIVPGMKVIYDEITGELNHIYYVDENRPSGYSSYNPADELLNPIAENNTVIYRTSSSDPRVSWGSAPNILTFQIADDSFLGTGRATYFIDPKGNRDNVLQNWDAACKMGYDATKIKIRANVAMTLRNLDTDEVFTLYHADVGGMPNAIIDIWGLNNLRTIYGNVNSSVTSIANVRYYHKRFSDQTVPTNW